MELLGSKPGRAGGKKEKVPWSIFSTERNPNPPEPEAFKALQPSSTPPCVQVFCLPCVDLSDVASKAFEKASQHNSEGFLEGFRIEALQTLSPA